MIEAEPNAGPGDESEPLPELVGKNAGEILEDFGDLVYQWFVDRESGLDENGFEVMPHERQSWPPLDRYRQAARRTVADDRSLALDLMDLIDGRHQTPENFADLMLAAYIAAELMHHDADHAKSIWLRCLLSEHGEIHTPAGWSLANAIREQTLPPDALAEVVFTLACAAGHAAANERSLRPLYELYSRSIRPR